MLKVNNLFFSYDDLGVLWDVSLHVEEGEIVTMVGNNGSGKSTLLRNISRLLKPKSGGISFNGVDLCSLESHQVVENGIVHVPEGRKIFPEMSVLENLRMGSYLRGARLKRESNIERVFTLFPRLKERIDQLGGTMSGGEQQMLAIARGLLSDPKLLMLDEPSLGLSPLLVSQIFEAIKRVNEQGVTILLIEQNVGLALQISDRAYVLETGKVVIEGKSSDLLGDEHIKKAFLGI